MLKDRKLFVDFSWRNRKAPFGLVFDICTGYGELIAQGVDTGFQWNVVAQLVNIVTVKVFQGVVIAQHTPLITIPSSVILKLDR